MGFILVVQSQTLISLDDREGVELLTGTLGNVRSPSLFLSVYQVTSHSLCLLGGFVTYTRDETILPFLTIGMFCPDVFTTFRKYVSYTSRLTPVSAYAIIRRRKKINITDLVGPGIN